MQVRFLQGTPFIPLLTSTKFNKALYPGYAMSTDVYPFQRKSINVWGLNAGLSCSTKKSPKMTLNARRAETAKLRDKAYKLADGEGLYLMVNTHGSKYWRT